MFSGVAEKLIDIYEAIIQWMYDSLVEPFADLPTLKNLVFGKYNQEELVWSTFRPSDLTDALNPMFYTMATLSGFFIVAFIVLYGIRIAGAPLNPQRRNESIDLIKDLVLVGIVLVNLPTLYDLLFTINNGILNMFNGAYTSNLDNIAPEGETEETSTGVLGQIFIQLILLGLMVWANFYYLMRKVTLIILMGMGPLMMAFWLHPQFKPITASWLKELIGSIFVQAIHAFVFWTVATISSTSSGFVETVIVYLIFIPISESIRRLLLMGGDMQGGLAKAGSMLGIGALAGMYGAVKGAIGDKSVMGALRGAYNGLSKGKGGSESGDKNTKTKEALGAMPGSDNGTTPQAEKMLKAGDIFSRAGKAVVGMAGAVAGSPMGPASSIIGATGGSALGGVVGGFAGRAGAAAIQGIADRGKKGLDAFKNGGIGKNSKGFEDNLANEVADHETASWANENKASVMSSLRERFPDATEQELESHFNKVKADKRAGFYADAKSKFAKAQTDDGKMAKGSQLVDTSAAAMANQWADENQEAFFANYDKTNPRSRTESKEDYLARRMNAFNEKKNQMRDAFANKGYEVLNNMGAVDGDEPVDRAKFQQSLSNAISQVPGAVSVTTLNQAGKQAVNDLQQRTANSTQLVNTSADAMANQWGKENQEAFFSAFNQNSPKLEGETDKDYANRRMTAFNNRKNQVRQAIVDKGQEVVSLLSSGSNQSAIDKSQFHDKLGEQIQGIAGIGNTNELMKSGRQATSSIRSNPNLSEQQLVDASSQSIANQWASENQEAFKASYTQANPQQNHESKEAYDQRVASAFTAQKNSIQQQVASTGRQVIASLGTTEQGLVNAEAFTNQLGSALKEIPSLQSVKSLTNASNRAISHVQGESVLQSNGKPNTMYLASRMANAKTQAMQEQFTQQQVANGMSTQVANQKWEEQQPTVHRNNLASYRQSVQAADNKTFSNGFTGGWERTKDVAIRAKDFALASTGTRGVIQGTQTLSSALQTGFDQAAASFTVSSEFGRGGVSAHAKGFTRALGDGIKTTMTSIAEHNGGVVESQQNLQNFSGYAAGMVLGVKGYQVGKSAMARFSPLKSVVQEQIKAPSEVIQMAQTITDEHGNQRIAPGAIKQVVTPTESYVEVRTKSGETQIVSQKGSGHSGLRKGDVIYQDLDVQGDSLVVSSPKQGQSSTYRLDSGGGRVPSSISIDSNPNELLGSPRTSKIHRPANRVQLPTYSQSVDNGQFYVEDLKNQGMDNLQVVIESDRQFVTAQKEGVTYRVSPMYAGDTRLDKNSTMKIPVRIQNNQLKPTHPIVDSEFAVNSTLTQQPEYSTLSDSPKDPYYSSKEIRQLIPSKAAIRAQRGLNKRQQLDEVRRKQGLLG